MSGAVRTMNDYSTNKHPISLESPNQEPKEITALSGLVHLASRLNSAASIERLLAEFSHGLMNIWQGAGIRICEVNRKARCLTPIENQPVNPIPVKGSLLGNAVIDGSSRIVYDINSEPSYHRGREAPSGTTWRSAIISPVNAGTDNPYVVAVFFHEGKVIGPKDLKILESAVDILEPLIQKLESQRARLGAFGEISRCIASAVDARDPYSVGHGTRVSEFAQATATVHGLEKEFIERLALAGLLHDIGRLGIPENILLKQGSLTPEEYRIVKMHPGLAVNFLASVEYLADVMPAILHHHERYDGSGYPDRLEGDSIPLSARLLSVADAFDAMTSPRPYRTPFSDSEALAELNKEKGKQFDPILVEAFLRAHDDKLILSQNVLKADDPLAEIRLCNII